MDRIRGRTCAIVESRGELSWLKINTLLVPSIVPHHQNRSVGQSVSQHQHHSHMAVVTFSEPISLTRGALVMIVSFPCLDVLIRGEDVSWQVPYPVASGFPMVHVIYLLVFELLLRLERSWRGKQPMRLSGLPSNGIIT
jgi:hypothetical protein